MITTHTLAEINERIANIRQNLRDLTEQAASRSGAADEDLASERIARLEAQLAPLIELREKAGAA